MRLRRIAALAVATLVVVGGALSLSGVVPRWTYEGTQMVMPDVLSAQTVGAITLPDSGLILFIGDSNTAGSLVGGVRNSYAATFAKAIQESRGRVSVHAFGGATVADLLRRPLPEGPVALAFVMMGTNDAATRGWMAHKRRVPIKIYRRDLAELVRRLRKRGAQIVILAPPPVGSPAMARRLDPYRMAAGEVAWQTGSGFYDPASAFALHTGAAMLQRDALHLSPEAQRILGLWLAAQTTSMSAFDNSSAGNPKSSSASRPS